MQALPQGTVTFLFVDIEGSTRLLQELGNGYTAALADFRRLLRDVFAAHGGFEVDAQGDAFFVAFARARDAVAAAASINGVLTDRPLRVRAGIHTGEPTLTAEGYVGIDVHRAARICAAGHGGQVLLSQSTRELLGGDTALADLGEHRLKDLREPLRLYQLGHEDFPPPKTLNTTNLPIQPTPLVGRRGELEMMVALLRRPEMRLLTLTGPGGTGKTRLALHVAAELVDEFQDGVFLVPLAPIRDPDLVVPTIAHAVGVKETSGESLLAALLGYLKGRTLLLVLDNVEHVLVAASQFSELLAAAAQLKILATSRARLHLSAEHELPVQPLGEADAVELFVERARAVKSDFEPDEAVPEICGRLDGLPLAVELAAARVKVLPPHALLTRLDRRLALLTGGPSDVPERQRTLRATMEWSYELLPQPEQELFARLAVFAGGFTLEAVEDVCDADLDALSTLVDESLVQCEEGLDDDVRFAMLETIREYALERLAASREEQALRRRHADRFLALAEDAEPHILRADQLAWLDRLRADHNNFRAALAWALERSEVELALRLIGSLRRAWVAVGYVSEARGWLEAALDASDGMHGWIRAKALYGLGRVALVQGDYTEAVPRLEESAALYRDLGNAQGLVYSLADLAWIATACGEHERARSLAEEAVADARSAGDEVTLAAALHSLACAHLDHGEYARARQLFEESLALRRRLGDKRNIANSLSFLGATALLERDYARARTLLDESVSLGRDLSNLLVVSAALANLALVSLAECDVERASSLAAESLTLSAELGDKRTIVECLHALAAVSSARRDSLRCAVLSGAAEALHAASRTSPSPAERAVGEPALATARTDLGEEAFDAALAQGRKLTVDEAVKYARQAFDRAASGHPVG
jgi:predicted ATPase/class 3 adenylate cyclase